jgi:hypothetical protein
MRGGGCDIGSRRLIIHNTGSSPDQLAKEDSSARTTRDRIILLWKLNVRPSTDYFAQNVI